jgi:hypothetical protein
LLASGAAITGFYLSCPSSSFSCTVAPIKGIRKPPDGMGGSCVDNNIWFKGVSRSDDLIIWVKEQVQNLASLTH